MFSISNQSETYLSWIDRLRVLFGRPIRIHTSIEIADLEVHDHGPVTTTATTSVDPIFPWLRRKPKPMGAEAAPEAPELSWSE